MARIKGGHTDPSLSREPRPRASSPQDSTFQAPEARPFHLLRVECPLTLLSADTRRGDHRLLHPLSHPYVALQLRGSGLQALESHRDMHNLILGPTDPQRLSGISPKAIIKRPMVIAPPIEGNSNYRARPFHFELYFEPRGHATAARASGFIWTALDGTGSPTAIHFNIDGCQGILEARHIAEALHIPHKPVNPTHFREWFPVSQRDMVCILSRGTSGDSVILRKRRSAIMDTLFRIFEGFYFGPYHLIMAAFLHFKVKVHRKKLQRDDTIPLLFPRLLCHILEHMGYPTEPHLECHHHFQERFILDKWTQLVGYSAPLGAPPRPTSPVSPQAEQT
ncbi:hypothetical protein CK203_038849 [Vitis vinifera]|uniref:Uncharacterized protein n=1 Tax=Vitis vinifera TaxID=29760 RepID=A0A438I1P4_VITVI|nr:hypothetical protein CK203_038849 [Vitis vinifera]